MEQALQTAARLVKMLVAVVLAGILVYRGQTYADPVQTGLTGPLMCMVAAILLIVTTAFVIFRPRQAW